MKHSIEELKTYAKNVRRNVIEMATPVRSSHTGGAFSATDILVALYFEVLKINPSKPLDVDRDIFIYSKGHSSSALYATLVERGFAPKGILKEYYVDGGRLAGHPIIKSMPGIEVSSGSLGHGLPMGVGTAIARRVDKSSAKVFVMVSDGECDEGSVWEAAMLSGFLGLDNLVVIVDYNKIQSFGTTKEVLDLEPFKSKWESFNWSVKEIDGHSFGDIVSVLDGLPFKKGKPSVVLAHTIKGKGVSFMENKLAWHYKSLDDPKDYQTALNEIDHS